MLIVHLFINYAHVNLCHCFSSSWYQGLAVTSAFGSSSTFLFTFLRSRKIPEIFKQIVIAPLYKKQGKPVNDPNPYRRIAISSVIGKLVEKVHLESVTDVLSKVQKKNTKEVSQRKHLLRLGRSFLPRQ